MKGGAAVSGASKARLAEEAECLSGATSQHTPVSLPSSPGKRHINQTAASDGGRAQSGWRSAHVSKGVSQIDSGRFSRERHQGPEDKTAPPAPACMCLQTLTGGVALPQISPQNPLPAARLKPSAIRGPRTVSPLVRRLVIAYCRCSINLGENKHVAWFSNVL